jgi:hypothetical protein
MKKRPERISFVSLPHDRLASAVDLAHLNEITR